MRKTTITLQVVLVFLLSVFCTSCSLQEKNSDVQYENNIVLSTKTFENNVDTIAENDKQEIEAKKQKAEEEKLKAEEAAKAEESKRQENEKNNSSNETISNPQKEELLVEKIKGIGSAKQIITVTNDYSSSLQVTVQAFEKENDVWVKVLECPGVIGFEGFSYNKSENNNTSPIGIYTIGTAFGQAGNPGAGISFRDISPDSYWVDDPNSVYYNTWQTGAPAGRWNSAEALYTIPLYKYGFVINYNTDNVVKGKGSAIFFHIWSSPNRGTAGCTAVSEDNVIKILKWLKREKSPLIVQGTIEQVENM